MVSCRAAVAAVLAVLLSLSGLMTEEGGDEKNKKGEDDDDDYYYEDEVTPDYVIPKGVQELNYNPQNLSDGDQHALHLPMELKCDGCRVIAYLLGQKFQKMVDRFRRRQKEWVESDIMDMVHAVCTDKEDKFKGYGLKEVNGVRRLSGEGLETKDVPGLQKGGGKWPYRLMELCEMLAGDIDEADMFHAWQAGDRLEDFLCRNKDHGALCPPRKRRKKKNKKNKKKKKKKETRKDEL